MKLTTKEVNTIKAIIEGGAGQSLYNRLIWDKAKNIHLKQEEKDILQWHINENEYLTEDEKQLLKKVVK